MTNPQLIDLQKGIAGHPVIDPLPQAVNRSRQLIEASFRAENLPIVLANVVDERLTLALDAMTDVRKEAHEYSTGGVVPRVGEPRLGETGSTQEIISLLRKRSVAA